MSRAYTVNDLWEEMRNAKIYRFILQLPLSCLIIFLIFSAIYNYNANDMPGRMWSKMFHKQQSFPPRKVMVYPPRRRSS